MNILKPVTEEEFIKKFEFKSMDLLNSSDIDPLATFETCINQMPNMAIGTYFWFIADSKNWIVHAAGGMMQQVIGLSVGDLVGKSPDALFAKTYPGDLQRMFAFSQFWLSYYAQLTSEARNKVKATIYIRFSVFPNSYKWIMIQYPEQIVDQSGTPLYGLMMMTDISHLKYNGEPMMSILNTEDESCRVFHCSDSCVLSEQQAAFYKLTKKEMQVLRYLALGYISKQIASEMAISVNTVNNHRQNMLMKTGSKSSLELINFAVRLGII